MLATKSTRPFFTSFCIGLASSLLAASLLVAPCAVTDAQATTADDLGLTGDVQVNKEGDTIDNVLPTPIKTFYVGMGVNYDHAIHHTSLSNKGIIILQNQTEDTCGIFVYHTPPTPTPPAKPCYKKDFIEVNNDGYITVHVKGISNDAIGINATDHHKNANITVKNNGSINVEGDNVTEGIYSHIDDVLGSIDVYNTGNVTVKSNFNQAYGIHTALACAERRIDITKPTYAPGNLDKTIYTNLVHNSGVIAVNSANGDAHGIYALTKTYDIFNITNIGTIKVIAEKANAYAIYGLTANSTITPFSPNKIINNGYIETTSSTQTACGITTNPQGGTTYIRTINNGVINTTSTKGEAIGAKLFSLSRATINNTGIINTTSQNSNAYGIQLITPAMVIVSNTGTINANGATASHELLIQGGSATIGAWTVTLRDYDSADDKSDPFAIQNGGQLIFSSGPIDDFTVTPSGELPPTTFIVTPGTAAEGFAFNKEFPIQDMICKYGGTITGAVGIAESALPFLKAELLHGNVASNYEFDGSNPVGTTDSQIEQTIIMRTNVTPGTSPGHEAEEQIVTGLTQNMNMLCSILDTQLDYDELPEDWRAFAIPYYTHGVNYEYGYDTDVIGIALGATHRVNDNFSAGAHLNFATIDSESDATENDALMAGLGVHGKYHFTDDFHIRGQVTGFVMENRLGLSMDAKPEKVMSDANTTSLGMYAAMFAAYDYKANEHHTFTPELALKYVYAQHDGYSTNWRRTNGMPVNYDISYGDTSFDELYAEASLRWQGDYDLGTKKDGEHRGVLHPTLRAGVRQALMGAEVESKLDYNGFDFGTTTSHANETSVLFEGGLEWVKGDTTTSLTYIADFGNKEESHMGLLKIQFEF